MATCVAARLKVGVFGTGSIGGYFGINLSASGGVPVTLVGRASLCQLGADRLHATTVDGSTIQPSPDLTVTDDPSALKNSNVILVTVKSRDTLSAAKTLREHANETATIVSFQNGISNGDVLRAELGNDRVVDGMVGFNVIREDGGAGFRQTTAAKKGFVVAGPGGTDGPHSTRMHLLAETLNSVGLPLELRDDVRDVLAGKLLLNLSNGVCGATGLPILSMWKSRDARWCVAQCVSEGLQRLRTAGYNPSSFLPLPLSVFPYMLRLPDPLFAIAGRRFLATDPDAKLSTLQDLEAGKPTEIDALNGAIVSLGDSTDGIAAPVNSTVTELIRDMEKVSRDSLARGAPIDLPFVTPAELRQRIELAMR